MLSENLLYGDLGELAESATLTNLREQVAAAEKQRAAVEVQLQQAIADTEEARRANEILARNISVLYNTAKAELDRKNRQIEQLEIELHQIKSIEGAADIGAEMRPS
mmetsp:Transcript_23782/g.30946  ORF Transcript_23782/g.30946 Transcript_23782/m.30946 type:complete len:107 (-) Transcript_23782:1638-1958(-)